MIRHAERNDLPEILEIYANARNFMVNTGNPNQWAKNGWPPAELVEEDIANRRLYVYDEDGIQAVFCFFCGTDIDPTYRIIEGEWIGDDTYGVIHRIASAHKKKGIGKACIQWAFEECRHLRMDTHPDNVIMQKTLESLGFLKTGTIHVEQDPFPRFAYEKL